MEKRREIVHLSVHSQMAATAEGQARMKAGARESSQILEGVQCPGTWAAFCCFPRCMIGELDQQWTSRDSNQPPRIPA